MFADEIVEKQSSDIINVYIDFAAWLNPDASIISIDSVTSSGTETISNILVDGTKVSFTIAGGTCGNHTISATIQTSDSETLTAKVKLRNRL